MDSERLSSLTARIFVVVSFGLLTVAVVEKLSNALGYTLVRGMVIPSRLLEYAVVLLVFVLVVLLRQIRDRLQTG